MCKNSTKEKIENYTSLIFGKVKYLFLPCLFQSYCCPMTFTSSFSRYFSALPSCFCFTLINLLHTFSHFPYPFPTTIFFSPFLQISFIFSSYLNSTSVPIFPFYFKTLLSSLRTHYMLSTPYQFSPVFHSHFFYLYVLSLLLCSCTYINRKSFKNFYLF